MTNKIKVMVEYESPKTDKFFKLMDDYKTLKETVDETVAYYKPLADVAEEKKMELILEQLKTIEDYLIELNKLDDSITSIYAKAEHGNGYCLSVQLYEHGIVSFWHGTQMSLNVYRTNKFNFNGERNESFNILGNWDKWNMYELLEKDCLNELKKLMNRQKARAEKEVARLDNIVGGN